MLLFYATGALDYLSFEELKKTHMHLSRFVAEHFVTASALFILTYIVCTALSLPIGIYLSFFGGYLFPQPLAALYVVIGATLGASILFWAAKTALQEPLKKWTKGYLGKFRKGFNENAASYMLFLRLIPGFPFWLVNLAPAFLGVPFWTYFWTTAVGILPGVFVFTQFGQGLGTVFEENKELSLDSVLNRDVKIALVLLGLFVLIPPLVKYARKRRTPKV